MIRSTTKHSAVAKASAVWIRDRYLHLWGFVDKRIQQGLIDSTILMELRLQDESVFEGKSAVWLSDRIELWQAEVLDILANKYHMTLTE